MRRFGLPETVRRFSALPVEKSSITITLCASANNRSTRCEPIKPAPPVTRKMEDGGWRMEDGMTVNDGGLKILACSFHIPTEIVCALDRIINHPAKRLPSRVMITVLRFRDVSAIQRIIKPRLCFSGFSQRVGQLAHEGRTIPPMSPRFCDHGLHSTRRASDLVGQRKSFLARKTLRELEYTLCFNPGALIHI